MRGGVAVRVLRRPRPRRPPGSRPPPGPGAAYHRMRHRGTPAMPPGQCGLLGGQALRPRRATCRGMCHPAAHPGGVPRHTACGTHLEASAKRYRHPRRPSVSRPAPAPSFGLQAGPLPAGRPPAPWAAVETYPAPKPGAVPELSTQRAGVPRLCGPTPRLGRGQRCLWPEGEAIETIDEDEGSSSAMNCVTWSRPLREVRSSCRQEGRAHPLSGILHPTCRPSRPVV